MKFKVHIADKVYDIEVGDGKQTVAWLGMAACQLYGAISYPKGHYIPTLVYQEKVFTDSDITQTIYPHPQTILNNKTDFEQDAEVYVIIRDMKRKQKDSEIEWYERAYGRKRHMMKVKFTYFCNDKEFRIGGRADLYELYVTYDYKMFPELEEEFGDFVLPSPTIMKRKEDSYFYEGIQEMPFGTIDNQIYSYRETELAIRKQLSTGEVEKNALIIYKVIEPKDPKSEENIIELEQKEEEEHARKEQEAMMNQRKLQEEREQEKLEKEKQRAYKQKIENKLEAVWDMMDKQGIMDPLDENMEEDNNVCLSTLCLFYQDLYDIFLFYTNLVPQFTTSPENYFITLQEFVHLLKIFKIGIEDCGQLKEIISQMEPLIRYPLIDSLNIANGLNFVGFVEIFMRISRITIPQLKDIETPYKLSGRLQELIEEQLIPNKEDFVNDDVKYQLMEPEISEILRENYNLLAGIYYAHMSKREEVEMHVILKDIFSLCSKLAYTIIPGMTQEKIMEMVTHCLAPPGDEGLCYVQFLEFLLRLTIDLPSEQDNLVVRLRDVIADIEKKQNHLRDPFEKMINENNKKFEYQLALVAPDEEDSDNDDEDDQAPVAVEEKRYGDEEMESPGEDSP